jgi:IS1 family transposase
METKGTIFYRSTVPAEKILRGIASLCEGVGIGQVVRIFEVDLNTVLGWLGEASGHVQAVSRYVLHELHVTQVQPDELYVLLGAKKEKSEVEEGTSRREKRRHCWLWGAIDAESKLLLAVEIGDRSLQVAQRVAHTVVTVLAAGVVPLFVSDQMAAYGKALLTHYGEWAEQRQEGQRRQKRRWMPLPALRYAQVVKKMKCAPLIGHFWGHFAQDVGPNERRDEPAGWPIPLAFAWGQNPFYTNEGDRASRGPLKDRIWPSTAPRTRQASGSPRPSECAWLGTRPR